MESDESQLQLYRDVYINDPLHTNIFQCTQRYLLLYIHVKQIHIKKGGSQMYFKDTQIFLGLHKCI